MAIAGFVEGELEGRPADQEIAGRPVASMKWGRHSLSKLSAEVLVELCPLSEEQSQIAGREHQVRYARTS